MKKILKETLIKNIELLESNLVIQTFGNLSIKIDEKKIAIKPSGVDLYNTKLDEISVVDMDGNHLSGLKPSVDTPTHLHLYKSFETLESIVHTHSKYATAWAQSLSSIPNYGTTHSDFVDGELICTPALTKSEIENNYEKNTGIMISNTINDIGLDIKKLPGILVGSHGAFSWGESSTEALNNAEAIEYIAQLASITININPKIQPVNSYLNSFHFNRKHGFNHYYGQ